MRDVEKLWSAGFALGASLENTVAIGDDGVMNPEGLRYADEFVRHKLLDAVGDLSLAGLPLLGTYRSYCGGHRMNFSVLEALFSSRSNYAIVEAGRAASPAMPNSAAWPLRLSRRKCTEAASGRSGSRPELAPIGRMTACRLFNSYQARASVQGCHLWNRSDALQARLAHRPARKTGSTFRTMRSRMGLALSPMLRVKSL